MLCHFVAKYSHKLCSIWRCACVNLTPSENYPRAEMILRLLQTFILFLKVFHVWSSLTLIKWCLLSFTPDLGLTFSYIFQSKNNGGNFTKELIRLALTDSQELQDTAHPKSYGVETSTKYISVYVIYELPSFVHELFPATYVSPLVLT